VADETAVVFHFSEDPTIREFVPHVAKTAADDRPFVWAVDESRIPDYWFPRQCPRAMAWSLPSTTTADRDLVLGPAAMERVHVIEYGWLDAITRCRLFMYRLPAADFRPIHGGAPHALVSESTVRPLGPAEAVGNLLARHADAGIELRLLTNLRPWWERVLTTTLGHSAIRLRNAQRP
jgi:hypothetical protein